MVLLSIKLHDLLTPPVLKCLQQNGILSTLEFLNEDIERISFITGLKLQDVINLRNFILEQFTINPINGDDLYALLTSLQEFRTGIHSLDEVLENSLPIGISEICGLSNSGKTQLAINISINCLINFPDCTVLYIDTKADFSAVRFQQILQCKQFDNAQMVNIMKRLIDVKIWKLNDLVIFLEKIKANDIDLIKVKLIILDSLPSLMFQHLGEDNKYALTLLNKFVNMARRLCNERQIRFVCINLETRWAEQSVEDVDEIDICDDGISRKPWTEKIYRCLGRYWQHIPSLVIQLDARKDTEEKSISATVIKSSFSSCGKSCDLILTDKGF